MHRVVVTGMGIVSAIGNNLAENRASLQQGKSGLRKSTFLHSKYKDEFFFGEVKLSNEELKSSVGFQSEIGLSRTDLLALMAFKEAVEDARLSPEEVSDVKTACASASTVGGMSEMDQLYVDSDATSTGSAFLDAHACNAHLLRIVEAHNIKGITTVINTACSSSANTIMLGARWIKSGRADRVIVGGADALSKFTVNGFNSLQILSTQKCRPFDLNRNGLNLGEAGAYLVLERADLTRDKKIYAEVIGYGNSNDAYHPSSLSEEAIGVKKAMNNALEGANCHPDEISYINGHGTATMNNDEVELTGISNIFKRSVPFSSTKSYTGHTLAAAGAVEAIFSILTIANGELYGSLNFDTPLEGKYAPVMDYQNHVQVEKVLSNSFGFAGNCSSVLFSNYSENVH